MCTEVPFQTSLMFCKEKAAKPCCFTNRDRLSLVLGRARLALSFLSSHLSCTPRLALCRRSVGSGASPVPSIVIECTAKSLVNWPLLWVPATAFEVLSAQKPVLRGKGCSLPWVGKEEYFTQFRCCSVPQLVAAGFPELPRWSHQYHSHFGKWETEAGNTELTNVMAQPGSPRHQASPMKISYFIPTTTQTTTGAYYTSAEGLKIR